ncbi:MAG: lactonase family protein [Photobacterium frigidiphilum]|uniref:lactonase family protein n=1 Tax=Photobacterium frigidiphilum TaxID=264736 RepID=UPI003001E39B
MNTQYLYVASYTYPHFAPGAVKVSGAKGISVYKIEDNELRLIQVIETPNPSFITTNSDKSMLYCVNELGIDDSSLDGRVSAFRIDSESGELSFVNSQLTNGNWPCHCEVSANGRQLLVANYGSGNFISVHINSDGSLGQLADQHYNAPEGCRVELNRQSSAHPHMILSSPSGEHVFGVDLGNDQINTWSLGESGQLTPATVPVATVASGSGPRHMVFSPNSQCAYVLNELSSSVDTYQFHSERASLLWLQSLSLLPVNSYHSRPDFDPNNPGKVPEGSNTGGEICIDSSGRYLYATNRGMNSIVTYSIDQTTGQLTAIDWISTEGKIPRGMAIEPMGKHLYVGNQDSDSIVRIAINGESGRLSEASKLVTPCAVPTDFAFV